MYTLDITLSDLNVKIEYKSDYIKTLCKDYLSEFDTADICVKHDENSILKEKDALPSMYYQSCESNCIHRSIAENLPQFNRFVFHGAAIEHYGKAYVFTAPSGTGKTTHIRLWKKYLGDSVKIINGDKPIIKVDTSCTVYGTPWCGKEGYQQNSSAPIGAICVLKQSKTNNIKRIDNSQALKHLMPQVYMPSGELPLSQTLSLMGKVIENVPIYMLECDISETAFKTSYNKLISKKSDA